MTRQEYLNSLPTHGNGVRHLDEVAIIDLLDRVAALEKRCTPGGRACFPAEGSSDRTCSQPEASGGAVPGTDQIGPCPLCEKPMVRSEIGGEWFRECRDCRIMIEWDLPRAIRSLPVPCLICRQPMSRQVRWEGVVWVCRACDERPRHEQAALLINLARGMQGHDRTHGAGAGEAETREGSEGEPATCATSPVPAPPTGDDRTPAQAKAREIVSRRRHPAAPWSISPAAIEPEIAALIERAEKAEADLAELRGLIRDLRAAWPGLHDDLAAMIYLKLDGQTLQKLDRTIEELAKAAGLVASAP